MSDIHLIILEKLGEEMTLRLLELHGGTQLYIPFGSKAGTLSLARDLSPEAEIALASEFGGNNLKLPLCKEWRARIYRKRGMTHKQIAKRLGCTERGVVTYLKQPASSQQMALPL
jgi:hypothetical protein